MSTHKDTKRDSQESLEDFLKMMEHIKGIGVTSRNLETRKKTVMNSSYTTFLKAIVASFSKPIITPLTYALKNQGGIVRFDQYGSIESLENNFNGKHQVYAVLPFFDTGKNTETSVLLRLSPEMSDEKMIHTALHFIQYAEEVTDVFYSNLLNYEKGTFTRRFSKGDKETLATIVHNTPPSRDISEFYLHSESSPNTIHVELNKATLPITRIHLSYLSPHPSYELDTPVGKEFPCMTPREKTQLPLNKEILRSVSL